MNKPQRQFTDTPATRCAIPLFLGVTGYTGSGKTYSTLRIATGMQKVCGGEIFLIDTETKRALQLADRFKFRHVELNAPFGSLDYLAALQYCKSKGASIVIVDSMSHEHSSEGGYLWQSEEFLERKCGEDEGKRHRFMRQSWIKPSRERKQLNDWIIHCGMNILFCYRAKEKMDSNFKSTGWQPETTSALIWEMTARFLLTPGSDGRPTFNPELALEKMLTKNPEFFRDWFKQGQQLDENLGQKLAEWAKGGICGTLKSPMASQSIREAVSSSTPAQNHVQESTTSKTLDLSAQASDILEDNQVSFKAIRGNPQSGYVLTDTNGGEWTTPLEEIIDALKKMKADGQTVFGVKHFGRQIEIVYEIPREIEA